MENIIQSTIRKLNEATAAYDLGSPIMSDKKWDDLYFQLRKLEEQTGIIYPNSPTQSIQYDVQTALAKKTHNHPMLSLDKTKDWNVFQNYFDKKHQPILMLKLDGLTCSLHYKGGKLIAAETRGNGEVGEDILHNALVIPSIPKEIPYTDELIVDGEIICTTHNFKTVSSEYKNPRNYAAGSIRLLDPRECATRKLTFVVWNIVKGFNATNLFHKKLQMAEDDCGFTVVPWVSLVREEDKNIILEEAEAYGYPIDGLVGRYDDIAYGESLGATGHHAKAAYAFKFYDEEYPTVLLDIVYEPSRIGQLTPVAVFEPIEIDGTECSRASLHNLSIMEELSQGFERKGDTVYVYKANAIIPQISKWEHNGEYSPETHINLPATCPICGAPTEIKNNNNIKTLWCSNLDCEGRLINHIDHFCGKKGLDIKGLSKMTLEKLIDWGWVNSVQDIYKLKEHSIDWIKKPGFGDKSVNKILDAIESSRQCELWQFISALGIPLIGSTYAKEICRKTFDWHNFREDVEGRFNFNKWDGFGPEMCAALWKYNYEEADKLAAMFTVTNSLYKDPSIKVESSNNKLDGMKIVITGKLSQFKNRDELKNVIENNGGKVINSVSKATSLLINNDINSESSKNITAKKFNIPIVTELDFIAQYLVDSN